MNKETIHKSVELLCSHLAKLNEEIESHGWTCQAQVYDMSKTLHGLKSAHCVLEKLA